MSVNPGGSVEIQWQDKHVSTFEFDWLRQFSYGNRDRRDRVHRVPLWDKDYIRNPPAFAFDTIRADKKEFLEMLRVVRDRGLCFIQNAPTEPGTLEALASRIGPLQESNFGRVQDLVIDNTKRSIANSYEGLKPHTDEPYRASPPGVLMFHCLETDRTGAGASTFLDGFEAAAMLRRNDPEGFQSLCRNNQRFRRYFAGDVDLIAEFPLITLDEFGNITGIRINDRVAAPLSIPSENVEPYYRGLQGLLKLCEDPDRMIERVLSPGDIAVFDNHRILHGRTRLTLTGRRWLQWIQVERGDFYSRIRILSDDLGEARDDSPFLRGSY